MSIAAFEEVETVSVPVASDGPTRDALIREWDESVYAEEAVLPSLQAMKARQADEGWWHDRRHLFHAIRKPAAEQLAEGRRQLAELPPEPLQRPRPDMPVAELLSQGLTLRQFRDALQSVENPHAVSAEWAEWNQRRAVAQSLATTATLRLDNTCDDEGALFRERRLRNEIKAMQDKIESHTGLLEMAPRQCEKLRAQLAAAKIQRDRDEIAGRLARYADVERRRPQLEAQLASARERIPQLRADLEVVLQRKLDPRCMQMEGHAKPTHDVQRSAPFYT